MSGHSKWSNIKNKKAAIDAKRSGIFTKMAKGITVAVAKGGGVGDPEMNFALRLAVDKARAVNMPKDNIERAIEKGMGHGGGAEIEELVLEGYAHGGVPLIIEAVTDSRNRTVAEIKNILEKNGGRLGEPGSVMYQFDRVGEIAFTGKLTDEMELELIDLGMSEFEIEGEDCRLITNLDSMKGIMEYLKSKAMQEISMAIVYRAKAGGTEEVAERVQELIEVLEDNDDVQEIYVR